MNTREQPDAGTQQTEPPSSGEVSAQSALIGPESESPCFSPQPSPGSQSSVALHIEKLVLHGFAHSDCYRIGEALERELTRLFSEQEAPSPITHDVEAGHLDGGALQVESDSNADEIGARVARAVYRGLS